jgi:predicted small lipoprotein YifL
MVSGTAAMTRRAMIRNGLLILAVLALASPLAGCGKKGASRHPEESEYLRQYPAPEEKKEQEGQAQPKQGTVGPGGFIYEYPNRPPSK